MINVRLVQYVKVQAQSKGVYVGGRDNRSFIQAQVTRIKQTEHGRSMRWFLMQVCKHTSPKYSGRLLIRHR